MAGSVLVALLGTTVVAGLVGTIFVVASDPTSGTIVLAAGAAITGIPTVPIIGVTGWGLWVVAGVLPGLVAAMLFLGLVALVQLGLPVLAAVALGVAVAVLLAACFVRWFPGTTVD